MPQVKGLAFRSVLQAVEALRERSTVEQIYASLGSEFGHGSRLILASAWYPIEDYVALWKAVQSATGDDPDFPRVIGRRTVDQDLKLVHKVALAALSVPTVLGITARLFGTYYDTGRCTSTLIADRTVRVHFEGCERFSAVMWNELRGASECFAERAARRPATATVVQGGRDGDAETIMLVRWDFEALAE